jgi:WD40 repeat protein
MSQKSSTIAFYVQPGIILAILDILVNILFNIAADTLPEAIKPFKWISLPLVVIFYVITIFVKKQSQRGEHDSSSTISSSQNQQVMETNRHESAFSSSLKKSEVRPPQSISDSLAPSRFSASTVLAQPLTDDDTYPNHPMNEPLPEKPRRLSELSNRKSIESLPEMQLETRFVKELPERPKAIQWSPDGKALICTFFEHAPLIVSGNTVMKLPFQGDRVDAICWSPDSDVLIVSLQGQIHFWDIMQHSKWAEPKFVSEKPIQGLDCSVSGLLAVWADRHVQLFTLPNLSASKTLVMSDDTGLLRWSPDGTFLAAGATSGKKLLTCLNIDTLTPRLLPSYRRPLSMVWLPASTSLVTSFGDRRILIWDAATGQELKMLDKLPMAANTLSVSLEQCLVASNSTKNLLFGGLDEAFPSSRYPGQWLAAWSPGSLELATIAPDKETMLIFLELESPA